MNKVDMLIASITDQSRILYDDHIRFLYKDEYIKVLKDVFGIYDDCEGIFDNTHLLTTQKLAFVELIYPFLHYAKKKISKDIDLINIAKTAMDDMECLLLENLSKLSAQAFFFKFSKVIGTGYNTSGFDAYFEDTKPNSDCLADRMKYDMFVSDFLKNRWGEFFLEYSALAMLMAVLTQQWITMLINFTDAFLRDYTDIRKTFFKEGSKGSILSIKAAEHNGLNLEDITLIINFDNNEKLIYKAKNIEVDRCFQAFLDWINNKCKSIPLKCMRMITADHYGWQEYVPQEACLSEAEVKHFYFRAGMLLGVLYVFGSSDMHCLNLIANGEYPVLIDMEALTGSSCDTNVLNTHFLPCHSFVVDGRLEYSNALSSETFTRSLMKDLHWEHVNTDKMKPVYRHREVSPKSVVYHSDKKVYSYLYLDQLLKGFNFMYEYVMDHKKMVFNSIVKNFSSCEVRYYPRVYRNYFYTIYNSLAPEYLKSGADRLAILQKTLDKTSMQLQQTPEEIKIYELEQLSVNSIPRFNISYKEGTLKGFNDITINELHLKAPMSTVKARINRLCRSDLEQQNTLIRKAFQDYKTNITTHETELYYV